MAAQDRGVGCPARSFEGSWGYTSPDIPCEVGSEASPECREGMVARVIADMTVG